MELTTLVNTENSVAIAMKELYRDYQTKDKAVIYKDTLKFFGFHIVTDKVRPYLDAAWKQAFPEG